MDQRPKGITKMGKGRSHNYTALPGHILVEGGREVFMVPKDFFCSHCEGGCKTCKFTGESFKYSDTFVNPEIPKAVAKTIARAIVDKDFGVKAMKRYRLPRETDEELSLRLSNVERVRQQLARL